ncbi:von Willebrand factor type A domain-containing protein [Neospora caninum Liverpool]|uniref:von Willebrand factor type A domain-containing protein n=1 Tax=Neospora caninum (strain Liverpool) TaxID=572307 RepID=F0VGT0_NEOCL|nr:von Willebrand factor type A domain-containing protein [Neospora caninum Liverpool]CBZ52924.1 von Willebrand factor type A domain-containing protein [Neospora caninum Liverpool]|eukprot:XP_003882956.1 von Willebrand factor type A domain-containing protein [Neospora caninum Liverpool]
MFSAFITPKVAAESAIFPGAHAPCGSKLDAVIVLDSGGSLGATNWGKITQLVSDVIGNLDIGPETAHVSAISFGQSARVHWDLNDDRAHNRQYAQDAFSGMQWMNSVTNTPSALDTAVKVFQESARSNDESVGRLLVVATDGCANYYDRFSFNSLSEHFESVFNKLENLRNLHRLVIGLGNKVCRGEVERIAGCDPQNGTAPCRNAKFVDFDKTAGQILGYVKEACGHNIEAQHPESAEGGTDVTPPAVETPDSVTSDESGGGQQHRPERPSEQSPSSSDNVAGDEVKDHGQTCKMKKVDAVAVLDSSMSVGPEHWKELLKLTKHLGETLDSRAGHSRFGLLSYSDAVTVHRKLEDSPFDAAHLEKELGEVPFMNGNTFTPKALDSAYEIFKETIHEESQGAEDSEHKRVLVLATDGCADIYGKEHGSLEKHYRVAIGNLDKVPRLHTVVVGIGKHICVDELRYIAGCDPHNLAAPCPNLLLTSWDALEKDFKRLDKDVCEEITLEEKEDQEMSPVVPQPPEVSNTTCTKGRVDAVAVLDGSGSISKSDWKKTREIAKLFAGALNIEIRLIAGCNPHGTDPCPNAKFTDFNSVLEELPQYLEEICEEVETGVAPPGSSPEEVHPPGGQPEGVPPAEEEAGGLRPPTEESGGEGHPPTGELPEVQPPMPEEPGVETPGAGPTTEELPPTEEEGGEIEPPTEEEGGGLHPPTEESEGEGHPPTGELPEVQPPMPEEPGVETPGAGPTTEELPPTEEEGGEIEPPTEEEGGGLRPPTEESEGEGHPPTGELPEVHPPMPEEPGVETPGAGPTTEELPPTEEEGGEVEPPTEEEGGGLHPPTEESEGEGHPPTGELPEVQPPMPEEPGVETPGAGPTTEELPPTEEEGGEIEPPTEEEGGGLRPPTEESEGEGHPPTGELPEVQPPMPEEPGVETPGAGPTTEELPPIEELPPTDEDVGEIEPPREEEGGELEPPTEEDEGEGPPPTEELPEEHPPMTEDPGAETPGAGPSTEDIAPPESEVPPGEGGFMPPSGGGQEGTESVPPAEESTPSETKPFPEIPGKHPGAPSEEKEEEGGTPIAAIAGGVIGGILLLGAAGAGTYALVGGGGAAAAASADGAEAVDQGEGEESLEDREVGIDIDDDMFAVDEM